MVKLFHLIKRTMFLPSCLAQRFAIKPSRPFPGHRKTTQVALREGKTSLQQRNGPKKSFRTTFIPLQTPFPPTKRLSTEPRSWSTQAENGAPKPQHAKMSDSKTNHTHKTNGTTQRQINVLMCGAVSRALSSLPL